jgi:hypothetical protein
LERERCGLLGFDVGRADHLAPFFGFVGDKLSKIVRRACKWGKAPVGKTWLDLGIGKACIDFLVELVAEGKADLAGC